MKGMSEEMYARFLDEAGICLKREGFEVELEAAGILEVSWEGQALCRMVENGDVRWRESWVRRKGGEEALDKACAVAGTVKEYTRLLEMAPELKAQALEGGWRLMTEFNGVVMAAHHSSRQGWEFVTWSRDLSGDGVTLGHYVGGDYTAAKRDFAVRAGLVPQNELFSQEQLAEIHRCVETVRDMDFPMTVKREDRMDGILDQIRQCVPDLDVRIGQAQNEDGQIADQNQWSQTM